MQVPYAPVNASTTFIGKRITWNPNVHNMTGIRLLYHRLDLCQFWRLTSLLLLVNSSQINPHDTQNETLNVTITYNRADYGCGCIWKNGFQSSLSTQPPPPPNNHTTTHAHNLIHPIISTIQALRPNLGYIFYAWSWCSTIKYSEAFQSTYFSFLRAK